MPKRLPPDPYRAGIAGPLPHSSLNSGSSDHPKLYGTVNKTPVSGSKRSVEPSIRTKERSDFARWRTIEPNADKGALDNSLA